MFLKILLSMKDNGWLVLVANSDPACVFNLIASMIITLFYVFKNLEAKLEAIEIFDNF